MTTAAIVTTDVVHIAYESHGRPGDPLVVLLHGFPYDPRCFDAVAGPLADDGHHVVVPYLRGFGPTRFVGDHVVRSGQQAALAADLIGLLDGLDAERAVLCGFDWGGRAACIVSALWPERVSGLVTAGGYNIQDIGAAVEPAPPETEHRFWYQYYFHGERGRLGLERDRAALCRLLWRLWSATWDADDATFAATAASFDNPDFVDVVVHSYRHRFGLVPGDPRDEAIEVALRSQPSIEVPTVVLAGADDGVDPPGRDIEASLGLHRFTSLLSVDVIEGCGHNPPQEAPARVVAAIRAASPFS